MIDGLWSLPGPARLAASIREALCGGGSCAVVAPAPLRGDGHWVFGAAEAADVDIDHVPIEGGRPPAAVLADHCGAVWRPGAGLVSELARHEVFAGRIVGLALPADAPDWAAFTASFLTALPAIPEPERPQLLVFCGPDDLAEFRRQRLPLTERWWWGTVGRIDTTVAAVRALGDGVNSVTVSCITEVCGHDLSFVEVLAERWDGGLQRLIDLTDEIAGPAATVEERSSLASMVHGTSPARNLLSDWDLGLVNAWERYEPFIAPGALPEQARAEMLRTRVWRGQLRELMPLVDEERARLAAWVQSGLSEGRNGSHPIEIGYLTKLLRTHPALKGQTSSTRLRAATWLRDTRNTLAHRDIIAPTDIDEGLRLLDADRRNHQGSS